MVPLPEHPGQDPDAAYAGFQRALARRAVVVTAWATLAVLPGLQLLEYLLGATDPALQQTNAWLRAPLVLIALCVVGLRYASPGGRWPRPAALGLGLSLMSVGWTMLWLHARQGDEGVHGVSHVLSMATVALAVLATAGARDLAWIYGPPLLVGAIVFFATGVPGGLVHVAHPALAMAVGAVICEMLHRGNRQLFAAHLRLTESAMTDALTGLPNRRAMDAQLRAVQARSRRHGGAWSVLMADLDHFKRVNDTWGHAVGDEVLVQLAQRLRDAVRTEDFVARWGGEEFLVLLQDTDAATARRVAEKIRVGVGGQPFATSAGELPVTLSLGVAETHGEARVEDVVHRADQALYEAKRGGRNRCEVG